MKWFKSSSILTEEQQMDQASQFVTYRNERIRANPSDSEKVIWLEWYADKDFDPEDLDAIKERIGESILEWEMQI